MRFRNILAKGLPISNEEDESYNGDDNIYKTRQSTSDILQCGDVSIHFATIRTRKSPSKSDGLSSGAERDAGFVCRVVSRVVSRVVFKLLF